MNATNHSIATKTLPVPKECQMTIEMLDYAALEARLAKTTTSRQPVPSVISAQDLFDTVANHLLTQNERSSTSAELGAGCMYRGPRGLKCAVGALLEDHEYSPEMEGLKSTSIALPERLKPHTDLLRELQRLHDTVEPEDWAQRLRSIAAVYGLTYHGKITAQGLFDTVVEHLRVQGRPAQTPGGKCMYRTPDGLKCAVGALIDDHEVTTHGSVHQLKRDGTLPHRLLPHFDMLVRLQIVHDGPAPRQWETAFEDTALFCGLTYTAPAAAPEVIPA